MILVTVRPNHQRKHRTQRQNDKEHCKNHYHSHNLRPSAAPLSAARNIIVLLGIDWPILSVQLLALIVCRKTQIPFDKRDKYRSMAEKTDKAIVTPCGYFITFEGLGAMSRSKPAASRNNGKLIIMPREYSLPLQASMQ